MPSVLHCPSDLCQCSLFGNVTIFLSSRRSALCVRLSLSSLESLSVNISRCRKSRILRQLLRLHCRRAACNDCHRSQTIVTDRYGKEPYSAPIVTIFLSSRRSALCVSLSLSSLESLSVYISRCRKTRILRQLWRLHCRRAACNDCHRSVWEGAVFCTNCYHAACYGDSCKLWRPYSPPIVTMAPG